MSSSKRQYSRITFWLFLVFIAFVSGIGMGSFIPEISLIGPQLMPQNIVSLISSYVGAIGIGLSICGLALLLGLFLWVMFFIFSSTSIRNKFIEMKEGFVDATISITIGFVLLLWYMCST